MFRVKSMKWLSQKRTLYYFCTGPNSVYVVYAPLYNPINFRLRWNSGEKNIRDGQFEIQVETECLLFKGLETRQMVLHGKWLNGIVTA
ncbi:Uncharacterized protein APZ42_006702 [Daphnia magna]|uniref:Uncharacterized protein n=1 Tax=Daphnia magna TaxID=35525 RepID=A0A164FR48_9CRUS|nr:Uncharacterized protein APZ42_006702 [Daphnia magna]